MDSSTGTEGYTFDAANMLLTRAGNSYTNDLAGNTLTGGGRTNTWDSQNRLVQCVHGADTNSFVYGADGIRRQSTVNGTATDFVLDASMFVRERRAGTNIATYLAGARGPEYRRDDVSGNVRWYLYDGLGSVLGEVDPSGTITSSRKYDVYGLVRGGTNPGGTSKHKFVGKLGHPSEDETGLIYMRARYYDPVVGRFASQDPACDGFNWYAYCSDDPVNCTDESGTKTEFHVNQMWRFSWWLAGHILTTAFIYQLFKCVTIAQFAQAGILAIAATICFAMAAVGLNDSQSVWLNVMGGVLGLAPAIIATLVAGKAGLNSSACVAAACLLTISIIEFGFIASIGADIP